MRRRDTLSGHLAVELDIYNTPTTRAAFAQASVTGTVTGDLDDLPGRLYDMTKSLMDRMNVEFEYQVRRGLGVLASAGRRRAGTGGATAADAGTTADALTCRDDGFRSAATHPTKPRPRPVATVGWVERQRNPSDHQCSP